MEEHKKGRPGGTGQVARKVPFLGKSSSTQRFTGQQE